MSDTKWDDEHQRFTDTSKGNLSYDGDLSNPDISINHVEGKLSMFKAAPDMYKALEALMQFNEDDDMIEYYCGTNLFDQIKLAMSKARGES